MRLLSKDAKRDSTDKQDLGHVEDAAAVLGLENYHYVPDTPEESRLVRKIDLHLLPMLWLMYLLNYVSHHRARKVHY